MDPIQTLTYALEGDRSAADDYNAWTRRGGFPARVAIAPHTDVWMRGIRYANVTRVTRGSVTLAADLPHGRFTFKLNKSLVSVLEGGE